MKILFAPSESKIVGGEYQGSSFCFDIKREEILRKYDNFLRNEDENKIKKLLGIKNLIDIDIFNSPTIKAIQRYSGVAYEYLDYNNLDNLSKDFIDNNLLIFSNLYGIVCAKDKIPFYKLKQGESLDNLKPEKYYKDKLKDLKIDDEILDLRAGFYEKFYKPKFCIKMKFIKNNKVVSHWAKAYRGIILNQIAKNKIDSFDKLRNFNFRDLNLIEIIEKKDYQLWVFNIKG